MGALDGIRILELARVMPAEFCTMLLADMGADVIKIEPPQERTQPGRSPFEYVNRNKRSITLNLKDTADQRALWELIKSVDVIVEGFRPGVTVRLGADYATLSAINPRLVYCSLSGFGQDGPYASRPAHDLNFIGLAGVLNLIGEAGRKPVIPLNLVADYGGASLHGALGIVLALYARERTGRGQQVDVSYLDSALSLLAATPNLRSHFVDGITPRRGEGSLSGSYAYYAIYETKCGGLLTIACTEPWLWANFCRAIGRPEFEQYARVPEHFTRAANETEVAIKRQVEAIMRTRDRDDWYEILVAADVCVGKVYEPLELEQDPQLKHREMVVDLRHPEKGTCKQFGIAIKLSDTPGSIRRFAPKSGQDTDDVFSKYGG